MIARVSTEPAPARRLVGLGAGGHAKSLLDALASTAEFRVSAILEDDPERVGSELLGVPILPSSELERLQADGVTAAFVGVGGVASSQARTRVFERLVAAGFELPPVVHASAVVSPWARLGRGVQVLAGALVNAEASLGDGAIVNTGALVEHDCRIGAHAHVAPGARLAGTASVGRGAHVGLGAVVIEGVDVGDEAFVAAGAVVVQDVPRGSRVAGVPAKELPARPAR